MSLESYLSTVGLHDYLAHIDDVALPHIVRDAFDASPEELHAQDVQALYEYFTPHLGRDDECCCPEEIENKPYDLRVPYGLDTLEFADLTQHPMTLRLACLKSIVESIQEICHADWFGIYRAIEKSDESRVLLKESYAGAISRAEFPLTEEFAKKSNNTTVGLSGDAIVVQNVESYCGPYYQCDARVNSECCIPIFDADGGVSGIIDAEAFQPEFFTPEKVLQIAKIAADLGEVDPLFSEGVRSPQRTASVAS